jgi:hypothetical protein
VEQLAPLLLLVLLLLLLLVIMLSAVMPGYPQGNMLQPAFSSGPLLPG